MNEKQLIEDLSQFCDFDDKINSGVFLTQKMKSENESLFKLFEVLDISDFESLLDAANNNDDYNMFRSAITHEISLRDDPVNGWGEWR